VIVSATRRASFAVPDTGTGIGASALARGRVRTTSHGVGSSPRAATNSRDAFRGVSENERRGGEDRDAARVACGVLLVAQSWEVADGERVPLVVAGGNADGWSSSNAR
jgi:hypothetical protein